jgi:hypothetical protein
MAGSDALMIIAGTDINMFAVYTRNEHARLVVAGFAASTPLLSDVWQQLDRALADVPALGSVVARLIAELAAQQAGPRLPGGGRHDG